MTKKELQAIALRYAQLNQNVRDLNFEIKGMTSNLEFYKDEIAEIENILKTLQ